MKDNSQKQSGSDQLLMFEEQTFKDQILSHSDRLAKISAWQDVEMGWGEKEVLLSEKPSDLLPNADLTYLSGKMLKARSPQTLAKTFGQLSKPLPTLGAIDSNGNLLIRHGFYPKIESGYTLSDILETHVDEKYFLSDTQVRSLTNGTQPSRLHDPSNTLDTAEETTEE